MSQWSDTMRSMLGCSVTVALSYDPPVSESGILHAFDEEGEVTLVDETGVFHWCWPNLDCTLNEVPT